MEQPKVSINFEQTKKDFDIPEEIWKEIINSKKDIEKGNYVDSKDFENHFCK